MTTAFFSNRLFAAAALSLIAALLAVSGCSRTKYRLQADQEAHCLVNEKSNDPRWDLSGFSIELDPRSRYYDPYDPDFPPMPPDDPASHRLMHCVDGKKGYKYWHRNGDVPLLENPGWRAMLAEYTEQTEDGAIRLSLDDAVRLAILQTPDYQEQLETVYLSALDVSTERFRFDVQFFGGHDLTYEHLGSERPGGESNTLTLDSGYDMQRQFATAGELLVGFANSTVWEFFGPNTGFTTSLIDFSLVQPLLRAGGRAVALEQLTIAERGLLANLRAFQRYRRGFYTRIAIDNQGTSEPQRRGGFFGATGLTGFTGQGSGGFGGVGDITGFGRGGFGAGDAAGGGGVTTGFAGGGAGLVGGYIGLLQQLQQIRNTEDSLNAQLRTLALLEANLEAGLIDIAQVDQFRQSIETERATLLQAQNALDSSLDRFKSSRLGLPPDLPIALVDTLIQPFQLIGQEISNLQNDLSNFIDQFGDLPEQPDVDVLRSQLDMLSAFRPRIAERIASIQSDLRVAEERRGARVERMTTAERRLYDRDVELLHESLRALELRFSTTEGDIQKLRSGLNAETRNETADGLVLVAVEMQNILGELMLVQARARLESVTLQPVELDPEVALEIARANRLDWMNNRAALVDTWRLIEFNANALKSDLTVRFSGDIQTLGGDNPVKFRDETGTLRARLEFDAPFTRLVERNNFRQQLIEYQQDRRQLIQFEDGVHRSLRDILRQMRQLEANLEIQRRSVAIAIRRVDQTRENLNRPVPPPEPGMPPAQFGPTAALNLLTALSDLRSSQNNFMSVWLNYYAARMILMRDLGIMRLDEDGIWIDEPIEDALRATAAECELPPAVPQEWFDLDGGVPGDSIEPVPDLPLPPEPGPALAPLSETPTVDAQGTKTPVWANWLRSAKEVAEPLIAVSGSDSINGSHDENDESQRPPALPRQAASNGRLKFPMRRPLEYSERLPVNGHSTRSTGLIAPAGD